VSHALRIKAHIENIEIDIRKMKKGIDKCGML
jgi:hypothetical protein